MGGSEAIVVSVDKATRVVAFEMSKLYSGKMLLKHGADNPNAGAIGWLCSASKCRRCRQQEPNDGQTRQAHDQIPQSSYALGESHELVEHITQPPTQGVRCAHEGKNPTVRCVMVTREKKGFLLKFPRRWEPLRRSMLKRGTSLERRYP